MKNDETLNIDNAKDKTLHSSMLIEAEGSTFEEVYHINKYELNNNFQNTQLPGVFNQDLGHGKQDTSLKNTITLGHSVQLTRNQSNSEEE